MADPKDISQIDTLDRYEYIMNIRHVIEVMEKNGKGGSFSISAGWGYGKSFVLEKLERDLSGDEYGYDYVVLHYNCWAYDYYEEPLVALLSAIIDQLKDVDKLKETVEITSKAIGYMLLESSLAIGSAISKAALGGVDIVDVGKKTYNDIQQGLNDFSLPDFDKNSSLRKSIGIMRGVLDKIASKKQLILIVDELDRCLPPYQIKILERMHHLMDGQPSITIYAINPDQLRKTIEQMYGGDSEERTNAYLKKFIDFQVPLPIGSMQDNIYERYQKNFKDFQDVSEIDFKEVNKILTMMFSDCDARTINKIWEKQHMIHTMIYAGNLDGAKPSYGIICVELMILVMRHWQKKLCGVSVATGLKNSPMVTPGMLVYSAGFKSKKDETKTVKRVQGLWKLWSQIASSLCYGSIAYRKEGERTIISLSSENLSILECIGIYWCNASDNKFLKYTMTDANIKGKEQFDDDDYAIGEFYKLACIIE